MAIAQRYVYDEARAEDAVQEAYTYLLEHPQDDKEIGGAYVDACVRNQCFKVIARDGRDRKDMNAVKIVLEIELDIGNVEIDPERDDADPYSLRVRWLRGKLRRLPEKQKNVLQLELKGMSSDEIAQRLGIKPSTVRTHRSKGIAKLQEIADSEKNGATRSQQPRRPRPLVRRKRRKKR